jgi:hypothetical protein
VTQHASARAKASGARDPEAAEITYHRLLPR